MPKSSFPQTYQKGLFLITSLSIKLASAEAEQLQLVDVDSIWPESMGCASQFNQEDIQYGTALH